MHANRTLRSILSRVPIAGVLVAAPALAQVPPDTATGSYLVYPLPSVGASSADNGSPVNDRRALVGGTGQSLADAVASPFGWHDTDGAPGPESTLTSGNNAVVRFADGTQPSGGAALAFTPALAYPLSNPALNREAAIVNAFYLVNTVHDILYRYGFDEASGNFQHNNYGRGGIGGDPVQVTVEAGGFLGVSSMDTQPDGTPGILRLGPNSNEPVCGLNNAVIIHELGHGLSMRLTGGPRDTRCLENAEQGGEGWADFLALALTTDAAHTRLTPRTDIRPKQTYTTDLIANPWTYANFTSIKDVNDYQVGRLWASALWEIYWDLIDRFGFDPSFDGGTEGNDIALQLVLDGLKIQPCWPGLVDARDAILAADMRRYGGAHLCTLWQAFARRGLGFSASQGSPFDINDGTAASDLPPVCDGSFYLTGQTATASHAQTAGVCTLAASSIDYRVGIWSSAALAQPVSLSVSGQPGGTTVNLEPPLVTVANSESRLSIAGLRGVAPGVHSITVTGTGASVQSTSVGLDLYDQAPVAPALSSPSPDQTRVSRATRFAWSGETRPHSSYELQIATDAAFSNVVRQARTAVTRHTIAGIFGRMHEDDVPLEPSTQYYWRVRAVNACGAGPYSSTGHFTTMPRPWVLLVDDDNLDLDVRSYYTEALDAVGLGYDLWDARFSDVEPDATLLAQYRTVIWFSGSQSGRYAGPGATAANEIRSYLDRGGNSMLLVSVGCTDRLSYEPGLLRDYFGVVNYEHYMAHDVVTGAGLFSGLGAQTLAYPGGTTWSTGVMPTPDASASVAFTSTAYLGGSRDLPRMAGNAGLIKQTDTYRTSFWGFPLEALPATETRRDALASVLDHLFPKGALGDVNRDGAVSIVDALMIAQAGAGFDPEPFDGRVADVDGNGTVDILDALQTARHAAGLCQAFPCSS